MPSDASDNTLVCDLRLPPGLALSWMGAVVAALVAVIMLPLPGWIRAAVAGIAAAYAVASAWSWRWRTPARLVLTGDGRCRGMTRDGAHRGYGRVKGALVRRRFVSIRTEERFLLVTLGMVGASQFRRLRSRLRTAVSPECR